MIYAFAMWHNMRDVIAFPPFLHQHLQYMVHSLFDNILSILTGPFFMPISLINLLTISSILLSISLGNSEGVLCLVQNGMEICHIFS